MLKFAEYKNDPFFFKHNSLIWFMFLSQPVVPETTGVLLVIAYLILSNAVVGVLKSITI